MLVSGPTGMMVTVSAGDSRRMRRISLCAGSLDGVKNLEKVGGSTGVVDVCVPTSRSKSDLQVSAGVRSGCCFRALARRLRSQL